LSSISEIDGIIKKVYKQLPAEWGIPTDVASRVIDFLSDTSRLQRARYLIKDSLK